MSTHAVRSTSTRSTGVQRVQLAQGRAHGVRGAIAAAVALAGLTAATTGCQPKDEHYEAVCQLIRREEVEQDDKGVTKLVDLELEWDACPGDQFQVVRGGRDFAACMTKYKTGTFVPVIVVHSWDTRGFYSWDVSRVGDCAHEVDWEAEGSFEKAQDCDDDKTYGETTGFVCRRRASPKLASICPWTVRN